MSIILGSLTGQEGNFIVDAQLKQVVHKNALISYYMLVSSVDDGYFSSKFRNSLNGIDSG